MVTMPRDTQISSGAMALAMSEVVADGSAAPVE